MGRPASSKAAVEQKPELSVTEQVKNFGIYIEEQKVALRDARQLIERLQADYNRLRSEKETIQQEAFASTDFFQRDLKLKKEKIQDLESKLEQKIIENGNIRKQWQDELYTTATSYKMEKAEFVNHIAKIEKELYILQHFSEKKAQLEAKLADAEKQHTNLIAKHKSEYAQLERKYIEQGNNMRKDYEKSIAEIERNLRDEVEDRVGQRVRNILAENERLGEELRMHVQLTTILRKDIECLESSSAGVSRDVDLLREAESLHALRNTNQARVITQATTKVVTLEKTVGNVVRHYGTERRALEEEHQKMVNEFETERQRLHRIIQTKTMELQRVRKLAQQILHERGDVETFLIDSLHVVLHEVGDATVMPLSAGKSVPPLTPLKKKRSKKSPTSQRSARSCPGTAKAHSRKEKKLARTDSQAESSLELEISSQMDDVPVKLEPTVDISQLSWTDREKVLRYLFAKINSAHQLPNPVAVQHTKEKYQEIFEGDDDIVELQVAEKVQVDSL